MAADDKRELILERAILRFSHFGIQKTTMNEIADDLSISKPSVYYYFPDKSSLVIAVIGKIALEYQSRLKVLFSKASDTEEGLTAMLELRHEFIRRYFMLHLTDQADMIATRQEFKPAIEHIRANELDLCTALFEQGIKQNELRSANPKHTAGLFLNMLDGTHLCILARQERQVLPDDSVFEEVLAQQRELGKIFLKGIQ